MYLPTKTEADRIWAGLTIRNIVLSRDHGSLSSQIDPLIIRLPSGEKSLNPTSLCRPLETLRVLATSLLADLTLTKDLLHVFPYISGTDPC